MSCLFIATTLFATDEDYSGNLLIKAKKNGVFFFCSSVAIRSEVIMTAAHCLDKASEVRVFVKGKKLVRVGFGGRNGKNKRQIIKNIDQVQILNDYIKTKDQSSVSGDSGGALFQRQNSKLVLVGIHSTIDGKYAFNPVLNSKDSWISSQLKK